MNGRAERLVAFLQSDWGMAAIGLLTFAAILASQVQP